MKKNLCFLFFLLCLTVAANAQIFATYDFESGTIPTAFTNDETYPWIVIDTTDESGNTIHCIRSGNRGVASSTSAIEITQTFAADGYITFDALCMGEGTSTAYDKCIFYIDGEAQFTYEAHIAGWNYYSYIVAAGSHTFKWEYTKDYSVNKPGDAFFVDNIVLGTGELCEAPYELEAKQNGATTIRVNWQSLSLHFSLRYRLAGTTSWTTVPDITENTYTITGLETGSYEVQVAANCDADNWTSATFNIQEISSTATWYGYAGYITDDEDNTTSDMGHFIRFSIQNPETIYQATSSTVTSLYAACYANGYVWCITEEDGNLCRATVNTTDHTIGTFETVVAGFEPNNSVSMSYNPVDGKIYYLPNKIPTIKSFDPADPANTVSDNITLTLTAITLAINRAGEAYCIENRTGKLYRIDLSDGSTTLVGNTGQEVDYVQSMAFDMNTGELFWAQASDDNSGLYLVNPTTAETVLLGHIGGGLYAEIIGMFMVWDGEADFEACTVPYKINAIPAATTALVSWTEKGEATSWKVAYKAYGATDFTETTVTETSYTLTGLTPETSYLVKVRPVCEDGSLLKWSGIPFTTHGLCDDLSNVMVTPGSSTATLAWTGYQDQYTVRYQTLESFNSPASSGMATVTLTIGDVWSDGSGYQMLLDADATAYGDIIPISGGLTTSGNASDAVYAEFEYKIPANADGLLNTSNIVLNNSVTISIPAGIYDFCITNPTPGDRMWIASSNGTVNGREDDYVFEAGKTYEFEVTPHGSNDGVDVTITSNIPEDSWTTVTNVSNPAEITGLNPETTYVMQVQGICGTGVTAWTTPLEFTTEAAPEPIEPGECGIATDCDGHDYPTVKIGDVCWMTKNLAVESCVTSGNVYSYVNDQFPDETANVTAYGKLYDLAAAMQGIGAKASTSLQSICPAGWQLPTTDQIEELKANYTADELRNSTGWLVNSGTNGTGFSWDGSGFRNGTSSYYEHLLLEGYLWAVDMTSGTPQPALYKMMCGCNEIFRVYDFNGISASIRCVKTPETFTCGTSKMKDANDNEYETMLIGTQCWTKTNLRATKDRNGNDFINGISAAAGSFDEYEDAVIYIPTVEKWNVNNSSVTYNNNTFGYYYNWTAANNVCPVGWHLPSDEEWTTMEQTQTSMDVTGYGLRGDHAGKLAGEGWKPSTTAGAPGNASDPDHNASGFSAVPAGFCYGSSLFGNAGYSTFFWSATQYASILLNAYTRNLDYSSASVGRYSNSKSYGYSVRCLRD